MFGNRLGQYHLPVICGWQTGIAVQIERKIDIHRWLILAGLQGAGENRLVEGFCERLREADVDIRRFSTGSDVLHPLHEGRAIVWHPDRPIEVNYYEPIPEDQPEPEAWVRSPFYQLIKGNSPILARRLDGDYRTGEFPLLDELQEQGITGYLAVRVFFGENGSLGDHRGMVTSYCTMAPGGFDENLEESIAELAHTFALAFKSMSEVSTGRTLMRTYLGQNAADRVLKGAIRRGRAEPVDSVLWYSDLKGFTRIADNAPRDQLMPFLNDYAECVAEAIENQGGEILKFMGDGILAMFASSEPAAACEAALDAAATALRSADALSQKRQARQLPVSGFHLGLHRGDVLYGNIGSRERLDFTVIGPTVNELARIENMCRILDQPVVISSAFARTPGLDPQRLVSLGRYALRGVSRPQELFTIDPDYSEY